jgi:hypothetical protein
MATGKENQSGETARIEIPYATVLPHTLVVPDQDKTTPLTKLIRVTNSAILRLDRQAAGPSVSTPRQYKNRCGQGKVAANAFLTNLVVDFSDSKPGSQVSSDKIVSIQNLFPHLRNRASEYKFF